LKTLLYASNWLLSNAALKTGQETITATTFSELAIKNLKQLAIIIDCFQAPNR